MGSCADVMISQLANNGGEISSNLKNPTQNLSNPKNPSLFLTLPPYLCAKFRDRYVYPARKILISTEL